MAIDEKLNSYTEDQGTLGVGGGVSLQLEVDRDYDYESGRVHTGTTITDVYSYTDCNGRTYHGRTRGAYSLPNDGEEQDRQDFIHHIYRLILDSKLGLAPTDSPSHVLDIATGTGIWAIEFAKEHPDAFVVGTDLNVIQPVSPAPNCCFIQENSETQDWSFPFTFDYIHARNVGPCFTNFALVCQRAYNHTSPGGWIEIQDASWDPFSIDGSLSGTALERWFQIIKSAGTYASGDVTKTIHYKGYLQQAGYADIVEVIEPVPSHPWARGRRMKVLGAFKGTYKIHKFIGIWMPTLYTDEDLLTRNSCPHPDGLGHSIGVLA
ncbi:hypothetical protein VTL71DRAFT_2210 [Oculimacula yallundae]|uniref:S-adenosyl-L-methionine-dependent methyltransferase n=1 Tax=Oculimacula yallundae TaxID=86028 RepID=A0ABR4CA85_9HELO